MSKVKAKVDPEVAEFEAALLRSLKQTSHGEGRVSTPEQIVMRRAGRSVGTHIAGKWRLIM